MRQLRPPTPFVCDTDVFSFLFNRDPVRGPLYAQYIDSPGLILPFAVVGELLFGAAARGWGIVRRQRLEQFMSHYDIEYPNYAICGIWADIRASAQHHGRPIERQDAWIAATAIYLETPLLTHNARHYRPVRGLRVITEPEPSP